MLSLSLVSSLRYFSRNSSVSTTVWRTGPAKTRARWVRQGGNVHSTRTAPPAKTKESDARPDAAALGPRARYAALRATGAPARCIARCCVCWLIQAPFDAFGVMELLMKFMCSRSAGLRRGAGRGVAPTAAASKFDHLTARLGVARRGAAETCEGEAPGPRQPTAAPRGGPRRPVAWRPVDACVQQRRISSRRPTAHHESLVSPTLFAW